MPSAIVQAAAAPRTGRSRTDSVPTAAQRKRRVLLLKVAIWVGGVAPLAWLLLRFFTDDLGANPIEEITHRTGDWTLRILLAALSITPIRRITGWNDVIKVRRLVGLFAFFWVCLHFSTYIVLDQFFGWSYIIEDVIERPYITAGFTGFVLLIPLAVTSTKGWIRRLGRRWARLHKLVYVSGVLGVVHYLWITRADDTAPLVYGAILAVLFLARTPWRRLRGRVRSP
jgi:sulfoxide reductase heme-binding subunit YedZ